MELKTQLHVCLTYLQRFVKLLLLSLELLPCRAINCSFYLLVWLIALVQWLLVFFLWFTLPLPELPFHILSASKGFPLQTVMSWKDNCSRLLIIQTIFSSGFIYSASLHPTHVVKATTHDNEETTSSVTHILHNCFTCSVYYTWCVLWESYGDLWSPIYLCDCLCVLPTLS